MCTKCNVHSGIVHIEGGGRYLLFGRDSAELGQLYYTGRLFIDLVH